MPRIPDVFLESVVYLYPSEFAARQGEKAGGTGFILGIRDEGPRSFLYVVSNVHVVRGGSTFVRVNLRGGGIDVLPLTQQDWIQHDSGDDVIVAPIGLAPDHVRFSAVGAETLLTTENIEEWERFLGPGTEVFFTGRLVDHEGRQQNLPVVRFGNIAMMPWEPIWNEFTGRDQDSFLVEARSLGGFSGSAVFVIISSFIDAAKGTVDTLLGGGARLLGVDWCHLTRQAPVLESDGKTPVSGDWVVSENTMMMGVVPAWKVRELLDQEEVANMRKKQLGEWEKESKKGEHVALDSLTPSQTREAFLAALGGDS